MRHVVKRHKYGCGIAALATLTDVSYSTALNACPVSNYDLDGLWFGQLRSALFRLKPEIPWKSSTHYVPTPFRLWQPKFSKEIVLLARLTPGVTTFAHYVTVSPRTLFDPDEPHSVKMTDARSSLSWRSWLVIAEIGV